MPALTDHRHANVPPLILCRRDVMPQPFFDNPSDNPTKLAYVMHDVARQAAEAGLPAANFERMGQMMQQVATQAVERQPKGQQLLADPAAWGNEVTPPQQRRAWQSFSFTDWAYKFVCCAAGV